MASETSGPARTNLAAASVAAGILTLLLCLSVVAAFLGAVGIILGVMQIWRKKGGEKAAWTGITLSTIGLGIGLIYNLWYFPSQIDKEQRQYYERMMRWKGVAAPDFVFTTLQGQQVKLSDLRGRRILLDFWATWCAPCVAEVPLLGQLREETSATNLYIVGISPEDTNTLASFIRKSGINYPVAAFEQGPLPYQDAVIILPTTFFIDRMGVIQDVAVGFHGLEELRKMAFAEDSAGEPKPPPAPIDATSQSTNR